MGFLVGGQDSDFYAAVEDNFGSGPEIGSVSSFCPKAFAGSGTLPAAPDYGRTARRSRGGLPPFCIGATCSCIAFLRAQLSAWVNYGNHGIYGNFGIPLMGQLPLYPQPLTL